MMIGKTFTAQKFSRLVASTIQTTRSTNSFLRKAYTIGLKFKNIFHLGATTLRSVISPLVWTFAVFSLAEYVTRMYKLVRTGIIFLKNSDDETIKCDLCHQIIDNILLIDEVLPEDIECDKICPNADVETRCVRLCTSVVDALINATDYPCEALKLCTNDAIIAVKDDEILNDVIDGIDKQIECKLRYRLFQSVECVPHEYCFLSTNLTKTKNSNDSYFPNLHRSSKPTCKLKLPVSASWKNNVIKMRENAAKLANTLINGKRYCGYLTPEEIKRGELCIDSPTGLAWYAQLFYMIIVFGIGTTLSFHAIETPSGEDDKHWLTFWMVLQFIHSFEIVTDVMLSKYPWYFFLRLFIVLWLMSMGAGYVHSYVRLGFIKLFEVWEGLFNDFRVFVPRSIKLIESENSSRSRRNTF